MENAGFTQILVNELADEAGSSRKQVMNTFVVTGAKRGDQVAVTTGLQAGEFVVTSGQQKLRNGAFVNVDNTVAVSNDPSPAPENN